MEEVIKKQVAANGSLVQRLRFWFYDKRWYFAAFFLPVTIMFIAYAVFKVYPFGDNSALVLDLNGQYVYYYEAYRDAFWGDGSFIYDWSRNLSGEMFGIFAYYLASPFMLIIYILPRTMMPMSIMIMQLAKVGTAAVTFRFFLKKISPVQPKTVSLIVFPTVYALMSYMVVQLMDPMWLDALIYLPLICVGVNKLVNQGKMLPYIIPLALMFIAHFYIGYMVGIFTFFYFCYTCLSKEGKRLPDHFFRKCVYFCLGTLVALMCAAFVLIPVYNSLKLGKFEFTKPDFSLATQFDFLTFATKMFPMSYDTVYPEGLPMIYCSTAALILVPLFFLNSKISIKEKTANGVLTGLLVVLMYIKPWDMAMHGFQMPQWLPFRYSFIFSFMMVYMAFRAFENLDGITMKNVGGIYAAWLAFLFWCERENYKHFQIFETVTKEGKTSPVIQGIWVGIIALSICFAFIHLFRKYPKSKIVAVSFVGLMCFELYANAVDTFRKIDKNVAYSKYSSYQPYFTDLRTAVDTIEKFDTDPFYRMEANFHRTVNDPIGSGYKGVSHSSSTMNAPALKMLHQMGYAYGGHYTKYDGATYMTDALFDIRYLMEKTGDTSYVDSRITIPEQYKLTTEVTLGDSTYKFYRNPNALGLGVVTSKDMLNVELSDDDPFTNQNNVFNALTGKVKRYFNRVDAYEEELNNVFKETLVDGHMKYYVDDAAITDSHVDYIVKMDSDSPLYMYFPTVYERNCNVWVQDEATYQTAQEPMDFAGQFFVGDNYSILKLGDFTEGQTIRVRVTIDNKDNEAFWKDYIFCSFDYETFAKDCEKLQSQVMQVTKFEDTYVEGTAEAEEDGQYLFTTIPYEEGWTIKVNGKEVKQEKALNSLIMIPLEKGTNEITFKFLPKYYVDALIVTGFGLVLLVLVYLAEVKKMGIAGKLLRKAELHIQGEDDEDDDYTDEDDSQEDDDEPEPDDDPDDYGDDTPPDEDDDEADTDDDADGQPLVEEDSFDDA